MNKKVIPKPKLTFLTFEKVQMEYSTNKNSQKGGVVFSYLVLL